MQADIFIICCFVISEMISLQLFKITVARRGQKFERMRKLFERIKDLFGRITSNYSFEQNEKSVNELLNRLRNWNSFSIYIQYQVQRERKIKRERR